MMGFKYKPGLLGNTFNRKKTRLQRLSTELLVPTSQRIRWTATSMEKMEKKKLSHPDLITSLNFSVLPFLSYM